MCRDPRGARLNHGRRFDMTTVSHEPSAGVQEPEGWWVRILATEMWATLAIVAMWIAVAVSTIWGSELVSVNGSGTNSTTIPTGILVALFASIGTWAVAKYGLGHRSSERG
jgi:hypothetical protein